jgi:hypothetical protein
MTLPFQSAGLLPGGPQPGPIGASPADEAQAAPFSTRVSSSHSHARVTLAGKDTSLADIPASFLSDDPRPMTGFLATLSEAGRKAALEYDGPETHCDPSFMNDPCLSAQRAMGIC